MCPANCKSLLLGNLNTNLRNPHTEREEILANFLDDFNVVNMMRKFQPRMGRQQGLGAWWTWQQWKGGRWYHSQLGYCLTWEKDVAQIRNVAF